MKTDSKDPRISIRCYFPQNSFFLQCIFQEYTSLCQHTMLVYELSIFKKPLRFTCFHVCMWVCVCVCFVGVCEGMCVCGVCGMCVVCVF